MQKTNKKHKVEGIYCIINLTNQKKYIGSSINIQERIINHKILLRNNNHYNPILQNSYNKYGKDNFKWFIMEETNDLVKREQFFIDTISPEFNIVKKVQERGVSGTKIHKYNLKGEYIKSYDYIKEACEENNINYTSIKRFLDGKYNKGGGFLWSLEKVNKMKPYKRKKKCSKYLKKKIDLFKDDNYIKTFDSLVKCSKYLNIHRVTVSKMLKEKRTNRKGYSVKYAKGYAR